MNKWTSVRKGIGLFMAVACISASSKIETDVPCRAIFNQMFDAINNVKTLRYNLYSVERIDNSLTSTHSAVKLNVAPLKIYYKNLDNGIEVLWVNGKTGGDAIVNPNGFPYVNLHLNPSGELMRKGQHQTLLRLGYSYLSDMLSHSLQRFPDAINKYTHRLGDTVWDNASCYKMDINFPELKNTTYIVTQPGETVSKIAARYFLNDYQVLTLNNISWYDDELKIGQKLQLPAAYAKHVVLFIAKATNLPVVIKVYDDKGLFEIYAYSDLQVNPVIQDNEFTENYTGYHF